MDPALAALVVALGVTGAAPALRATRAIRRHRRMSTIHGLTELTPLSFERTVGGWMSRSGWLVEARGGAGDEGIDLMAFRDGRVIAVQCKRYQPRSAVAAAQVREFYGSATAAGADVAVLVTTGRLTGPAQDWIGKLPPAPTRMEVICGDALARLARARRWDPARD